MRGYIFVKTVLSKKLVLLNANSYFQNVLFFNKITFKKIVIVNLLFKGQTYAVYIYVYLEFA